MLARSVCGASESWRGVHAGWTAAVLAGINNSTRHRSQDQVAALHQLEQARSSRVLLASVFALARWVRYTASYHPNHPCGKRILCTGGSQSSPRPTASIGGVAGATGALDTIIAGNVTALLQLASTLQAASKADSHSPNDPSEPSKTTCLCKPKQAQLVCPRRGDRGDCKADRVDTGVRQYWLSRRPPYASPPDYRVQSCLPRYVVA